MADLFVAGGTGFVGRGFVDVAVDAGLDLCVLTRSTEAADALRSRGISAVVGDLATPGPWAEEAATATRAVYIAGPPTWGQRLTRKRARQYEAGMTAMTQAFLASLNPDRIEQVVYVAGASYYGDTGDTPAVEDQPPVPKGTGPYIEPAIRLAEAYGRDGLPVSTTFPGAVYGVGSWLHQLILQPLHRQKPVPSLRGHDPAISLVHLEDCGRALLDLLFHGEAGQRYFIADDEPASLTDILELASQVTGISYRSRPLPAWLCRLAIGPVLTDAARANVVVSNPRLKDSGFALAHPTMHSGLPPVIEQWRAEHLGPNGKPR